jgi:hypothetical protein
MLTRDHGRIQRTIEVSEVLTKHTLCQFCHKMRYHSHIFIAIALFFCQVSYADTVAYLYALDADATALKQQASSRGQSLKIGTTQVSRVSIAGNTVYVARMGVGCVETTIVAQAILSKFRCDYLVSTGVVGTLSPKWKIDQWA